MKNAVNNRGIKNLWHFTRLENLDSILSNGIVPRQYLEDAFADFVYNDLYRLDGQKSASCFSINHPNYKMFYSLRMQNPEQKWVVIACSPRILWQKECAFCYENAASSSVTCIPLPTRKGVAAFQALFAPAPGKPTRDELKIEDMDPTNPQAEVLVFDTIEPNLILGTVCQTQNTRDMLRTEYPDFKFITHSSPFSYRLDYAHWR